MSPHINIGTCLSTKLCKVHSGSCIKWTWSDRLESGQAGRWKTQESAEKIESFGEITINPSIIKKQIRYKRVQFNKQHWLKHSSRRQKDILMRCMSTQNHIRSITRPDMISWVSPTSNFALCGSLTNLRFVQWPQLKVKNQVEYDVLIDAFLENTE